MLLPCIPKVHSGQFLGRFADQVAKKSPFWLNVR